MEKSLTDDIGNFLSVRDVTQLKRSDRQKIVEYTDNAEANPDTYIFETRLQLAFLFAQVMDYSFDLLDYEQKLEAAIKIVKVICLEELELPLKAWELNGNLVISPIQMLEYSVRMAVLLLTTLNKEDVNSLNAKLNKRGLDFESTYLSQIIQQYYFVIMAIKGCDDFSDFELWQNLREDVRQLFDDFVQNR